MLPVLLYTWQRGRVVRQLYQIMNFTFHLGISTRVGPRGMKCDEIRYAAVMQSVMVGCSILSIVLSQFVVFISIRALGWMSHVRGFCNFQYCVRLNFG